MSTCDAIHYTTLKIPHPLMFVASLSYLTRDTCYRFAHIDSDANSIANLNLDDQSTLTKKLVQLKCMPKLERYKSRR